MSQGYPVQPVTVSVFVPAAPDTVFGFVSDTRNDPEWCPNVTDVKQANGDGVAVGAEFEFHQVVRAGGRSLESQVSTKVTDLGASTVSWRVEDRFQTRDVSLTVTPEGDGSRITQTTAATFRRRPGFVTRLLYPLLAKRTFKEQFQHLASRLSG